MSHTGSAAWHMGVVKGARGTQAGVEGGLGLKDGGRAF